MAEEHLAPRSGLAPVPLFRPEVLEARREESLGTALVIQPVSTTLLTAVSVLIAVALGVLAGKGNYTRKARVGGYLVPSLGIIKVYSLETGTIVEKRVAEGSRVSKGQPLFVVSMERSNGEETQAQAAAMGTLRERRASLANALSQQRQASEIEGAGLQKQVDALDAQLARIADEIKTGQSRVASAQTVLAMYQRLVSSKLASAEQQEEQHKVLLTEQSNLQSLEREQEGLVGQRDALRAQLASQQVKAVTDQGATERDMATLDQQLTEYESRRTFIVTAPFDGIATTVLGETGQTATPTQPLMSLLPAGAVLQAHLFVPSASIGFIAPGQDVVIRYQAFPYQQFGSYTGRVVEISRSLILPNETTLPLALGQPAYRVIVTLNSQFVTAYGKQFSLQSGMQLDANVSLDRHKLYQWVLDPLYSLKGSI